MRKDRVYLPFNSLPHYIKIKEKSIVHKLKAVLHAKAGDEVYIFNGKGKEWRAEIKSYKKKEVLLEKKEISASQKPLCLKVALAFAILHTQRISFLLEKTTELGVDLLIPFISSYTQVRNISSAKIIHWQNIVIEAVRQSERLWLPEVLPVQKWQDIVSLAKDYKQIVVLDKEGKSFKNLQFKKAKHILLIVGPEGGFSEEEKNQLKSEDVDFAKLSSSTLRAETAAVLAVGLTRILANNDI